MPITYCLSPRISPADGRAGPLRTLARRLQQASGIFANFHSGRRAHTMQYLLLCLIVSILGCGDNPPKELPVQPIRENVAIIEEDEVYVYVLNLDTWEVSNGLPAVKGRYWLGMVRDGQAFVDTNGGGFVEVNSATQPFSKPTQIDILILGDVNLDGSVNQSDVFVFFLMLIGGEQDFPQQANINRDETTDWTDLSLLGSFVFGGPNAENPHNIGQPIPTTEPDINRDGSSLERAIIVDANSTTNGYLTGGDAYYYRVDIDSPGTLTAYTMGSTDTYGYLEDHQGAVLERNDDISTGNRNFRVSSSLEPGTYHVRVRGFDVSTTGSYVLHVEFQASSSARSYNIELEYVTDFSNQEKEQFEMAARHWEEIIAADVEDVDLFVRYPFNSYIDWFGARVIVNRQIDDVLIFVNRGRVIPGGRSGAAASSEQGVVRESGSGLPCFGLIRMYENVLDAESIATGKTYSIFLHEIAHVLGFGLIWERKDLLFNPSENQAGLDTYFGGLRAIDAFNRSGGTGYTGLKVPVENSIEVNASSGRDAHWRLSVFGDELMTYVYRRGDQRPLSEITIQSLADLGYEVNASRAEPYSLPNQAALIVHGGQEVPGFTCTVHEPIAVR